MDQFYEYPNWNMRIGVVNREKNKENIYPFSSKFGTIYFLPYAVMIFGNSTYIKLNHNCNK
jgi:hypothetical protein